MIIQDRDESRRVFFQAWQKFRKSTPMEPLELMVCHVIQGHPEYHIILDDLDLVVEDQDCFNEQQNPFLHMGLHIALLEQVSTDRPIGISSLYQSLLTKYPDEHQLQHIIMDCLEESLWKAQQTGAMPDERAYMESLRKLT